MFQSSILVYKKIGFFKTLRRVASSTFFAAILLFFFMNDWLRSEKFFLSGAFLIFAFIFSWVFWLRSKKEILTEIDESQILYITLVFWYTLIVYFYKELSVFLILILLLPSFGVLFLSFTSFKLSFSWKIFFSVWFIILMIFLEAFYFFYGIVPQIGKISTLEDLSSFHSILFGISCSYVINHLFYCLSLIGISGEGGDVIENWKKNVRLIVSRYSDKQLKPIYSFWVIILQGSVLFLNHFLKIFSDFTVINFSLLLIPQFISFLYRVDNK